MSQSPLLKLLLQQLHCIDDDDNDDIGNRYRIPLSRSSATTASSISLLDKSDRRHLHRRHVDDDVEQTTSHCLTTTPYDRDHGQDDDGRSSTWRIDHRAASLEEPQAMGAAFAFDLCALAERESLDDKASNRELFDKAAKKLVQAAMAGSNVSILAYGQTSSGKTHSVLGTPFEPGLLPLSVEDRLV
ncbi:StAR-related lipid transfer protein 9 [Symbiodinium microadriaticum]|uniref:StAR-related lipid transfer protein 9 n=1 Tax=Symbiodinium microadriaticum TaxID=2951 RepID=A0A1Q9DIZ7_SYMMI|nr:StAR-related lipid transfer protein 9 [Symbiodinium microadriaticum]